MKNPITNEVNKAIFQLWKDYNISDLVPQFYGNLNSNSLLIVGLNPSFSIKGFHSFLKGTEYDKHLTELEEFYSFNRISKSIFLETDSFNLAIRDFIEIENISKRKYSYYTKAYGLAKQLGVKYEYIDLFFMRDTKQKKIENLYKNGDECVKLQIELSKRLLQLLQPNIILVANAFASKVFSENYHLIWDDAIGTYRLDSCTPVFLSSMLTGQRALDRGSFERLKWHLNFVINKTQKQEANVAEVPII